MPHTIVPANDIADKDVLGDAAIPRIPPTESGFFSLDNVVFSNVQKRIPLKPIAARRRAAIYLRLPGLTSRPIRPRKFIRVADAEITTLRTVPVKETQTDGVTLADSTTFTSALADFTTGTIQGDYLIISTSTSQGRYKIVEVIDANTIRLAFLTPSATVGNTFHVIPKGSFVEVVNELAEIGALEIRNDSGTLQTLDGNPTGVPGVVPV